MPKYSLKDFEQRKRLQAKRPIVAELKNRPQFDGEFEISDGVLKRYHGTKTTVKIPDGITAIGEGAFYGYRKITEITIPQSVIKIGESAFEGCSKLSEIEIPSSVLVIGKSAFENCFSLESVIFHANLQIIGEAAFYMCCNLDEINLPNHLMKIGKDAFVGTGYAMNEHNWDSYVLYIGNYLICAKDTKVGEVAVKEGTIGIADSAFEYCSNVTEISLPESIKSIGEEAFFCSGVSQVKLSKNLRNIGSYAFCSCENLKEIIIPEEVSYIGEYAFISCFEALKINCETAQKPKAWNNDWDICAGRNARFWLDLVDKQKRYNVTWGVKDK